jgi:hypothetical protein
MSSDEAPLVDGWYGPNRPYDLLREAAIAFVVVFLLVVALAIVFGAPSQDATTFEDWATNDPVDLATTTLAELDGTSDTAGYGPPYTSDGSASQSLLGVAPAKFTGRTIPIDTAEDLVLAPLASLASPGSQLDDAISTYRAASADEHTSWSQALSTSLRSATVGTDRRLSLPAVDDGPLGTIVSGLVDSAQDGAFTAATIDGQRNDQEFYVLDQTASTLFMGDGSYLARQAEQHGLSGDRWGAVDTLGHWPGQWWLVLFSLWYQFSPGTSAANADLVIALIMGALSVAMLALPWIPGLRSLPRRLGADRLVWRRDDDLPSSIDQ